MYSRLSWLYQAHVYAATEVKSVYAIEISMILHTAFTNLMDFQKWTAKTRQSMKTRKYYVCEYTVSRDLYYCV